MRTSALGRIIVKSRRIWRDLVFRGMAFLSLTILAVGLAWNHPNKIQEPHSQQSAEDRRESADERIANYTFWLDILTGFLAVSTLGLWILTWRGLGSQAKDMRRSLRISAAVADAAKKSADASLKAANAAGRRARPYLHFVEGEIRCILDGDLWHQKGSATFKNIGSIPAIMAEIATMDSVSRGIHLVYGCGYRRQNIQIIGQGDTITIAAGPEGPLQRREIDGPRIIYVDTVVGIGLKYSGDGADMIIEETWLHVGGLVTETETVYPLKRIQRPQVMWGEPVDPLVD